MLLGKINVICRKDTILHAGDEDFQNVEEVVGRVEGRMVGVVESVDELGQLRPKFVRNNSNVFKGGLHSIDAGVVFQGKLVEETADGSAEVGLHHGRGGTREGVNVACYPIVAQTVQDVDDLGPEDKLSKSLHEENHGEVEREVQKRPYHLPQGREVS
jgi:hypothetical protein